MRFAILLLLFVGVQMVAATKNRNYSHFVRHRARPREIRGFKPEQMGTAIGFGKRGDNYKKSRSDNIVSTSLQNYPRGIQVEWMLPQLKPNPILMGKFIQLLLDADYDFPTAMNNLEAEKANTLL